MGSTSTASHLLSSLYYCIFPFMVHLYNNKQPQNLIPLSYDAFVLTKKMLLYFIMSLIHTTSSPYYKQQV